MGEAGPWQWQILRHMEEDIFEETVTVPLGQTVSVTGGRKVGR